MTPVWHDGPLVAVDLETDHHDPKQAYAVQIAVALISEEHDVTQREWLVKPRRPMAAEAVEVHGISTERAEAEGEHIADVLPEVLELLERYVIAGAPLIAFNARYDLTVLEWEAQRQLLTGPGSWEELRVVDPLVIDKRLETYRKGSRKLDAQCKHYRATLDGAHDAANDALAAARLAWAIGKRGRVVRRTDWPEAAAEYREVAEEWATVRDDLAALHVAQQRWAQEEQLRLADYFDSVGKSEAAADARGFPQWPLVPFMPELEAQFVETAERVAADEQALREAYGVQDRLL